MSGLWRRNQIDVSVRLAPYSVSEVVYFCSWEKCINSVRHNVRHFMEYLNEIVAILNVTGNFHIIIIFPTIYSSSEITRKNFPHFRYSGILVALLKWVLQVA
jgi:hypothetical protein